MNTSYAATPSERSAARFIALSENVVTPSDRRESRGLHLRFRTLVSRCRPLDSLRSLGVTTLVLAMPLVALAQRDTTPQRQPAAAATPTLTPGPAIRKISTASALSTEQLGVITSVRQLRNGQVLLNDGTRRRLLLLDTSLKLVRVVLDSLSDTENFYGTSSAGLLPYKADTTLFVDANSLAMIILDPEARPTRVRSVPRVNDVYTMTQTFQGFPGIDAKGRLVYRMYAEPAPPKVAPPDGMPWFPQSPDSAFVVGIDIDTRHMDTLGVIRIPKQEANIRMSPTGQLTFTQITNPLPSTDEWAVLSDGSLAFVRGRDYRIDYRDPAGKMTSSAKLPYPWQRLDETGKQKLVDSVRQVQTRQAMTGYVGQLIRWVNQWNNEFPKDLVIPPDFAAPPGLQKTWKLPPGLTLPKNYVFACAPGEEPTLLPAPGAAPGAAAPAAAPPPMVSGTIPGGPPGPLTGTPSCIPGPVIVAGGVSPPMPTIRTNGVMAAEDLPDYRPPFAVNAVRADGDGNLWVRINTPTPITTGVVYDVINRQGELVDRIQLPVGYTLVGFGAGKIVYLSMRDPKGIHLARVVLR